MLTEDRQCYLDFAHQVRGIASKVSKLEAMAADHRVTSPYYAPLSWIKTYVEMLAEKVDQNMPEAA